MSHLEYACPNCSGTVLRSKEPLEQTRPHQFYRCPDCWERVHFRDLKTRSTRLDLLNVSGFRTPSPDRLAIGTATATGQGDLGEALITPFWLYGDQTLVVAEVHDAANLAGPATLTWSGQPLSQQAFGNWGSGSDHALSVWTLAVPNVGNGPLVMTLQNPIASGILLIATAYGRLSSATVDVTQGFDAGSGQPDTGLAGPTAQANELILGFVGLESGTEPTGDWTDNMASGQKTFTTNVSLNLYEGYRTVAAIGSYRARKADAVSVPWEARICTFRRNP